MAPSPELDLYGHPKYEWLKCLGAGTFGAVGLCRVIDTDEMVAVKCLALEMVDKNTQREVMNHRKLRHSHIIEFKEVFLTEHYICIAMEYANHDNLFNYVKRRTMLQEPLARWFFQQLIMALDYCHSKGVVNRDMKLENTLLQAMPNKVLLVKLCDFGYSKAVDQSLPKSKVGTSSYVAPEVILSASHYDGRMADIWSCGVMLYIMLFGKYPFFAQARPGQDQGSAVMTAIVNNKFTIPDDIPISPECRDLLVKLFCKEPTQRITMSQIQEHPWFTQYLPPEALVMNKQCLDDTRHAGAQSDEEARAVLSDAAERQRGFQRPNCMELTEMVIENTINKELKILGGRA